MIRRLFFTGMLMGATASALAQVSLKSNALQLQWTKQSNGWKIHQLSVKNKNTWISLPAVSGEYTLLYAEKLPDSTFNNSFPEPQYRYIIPLWKGLIQPVPMNTAGQAVHFYPSDAEKSGTSVVFNNRSPQADINATWKVDPDYPSDIRVKIILTAKQTGYFSLATPTVATVLEKELAWAGIPGYYQSNALEHDFIKANVYMQGIPDKPVIVRERTAATLSPFISAKNNITLAVIPDPGTGRDPWENDSKTQSNWQLGLSLMNRKASLTPTAYHPVLGEKGSLLQKGDTVSFSFRYTIQYADWYTVYKHAVNDVYRFSDFLKLKKTSQSLTSRILSMHKYLVDAKTSLWATEEYKGMTIGAQAYLGGVYGSEKDAMKNSDYGAMWMLANITNDPALKAARLPYARNFKLQQQDLTPGFFYGAAAGQYYLSKSKRFTEEWGPYVEPIGTTYYILMDAGNILLFQPKDTALKHALQLAADKLLGWMDSKGQWQVAYDHATQAPMFKEVEDLRPTFYGLLIAYKILRDKKYLDAAKKGANWYIKNAVEKGRFLGVCGDTRFVPDFATAQSAQALLELYDVTKEKQYLQAAIQTARLYTTSIYTHPIPTTKEKTVNGVKRQDWEISQAGLSFEHGGTLGSANHRGPILLASHAGMFVRMYTITRDSLFLQMARAAALGRDAFVDKATSVASYYWDVMNKGAGPYPHHAWWQIGWITDYLLAEAEMRSGGQVKFPRGFITPKVGPHQSYGFAPGKVNGIMAELLLEDGLLKTTSPYLDYYCAINRRQKKLFFILLNNDDEVLQTTIQITAEGNKNITLKIPPYGIKVIATTYK